MTTSEKPGAQPAGHVSESTIRAVAQMNESAISSLPVLTEVVPGAGSSLPAAMNEQEMQQMLRHLETRIETLFTQKLGQHLEQLQRQAIDRALEEIKSELPELLRKAMDTYLASR